MHLVCHSNFVIPAQAGIHHLSARASKTGFVNTKCKVMDSGLRRNDEVNALGHRT